MNPLLQSGDLRSLVDALTIPEKADLLTGHRMWRTHAIERLDIPDVVMTDGTYGVRYSIPQIDGDEEAGQDFEGFLAVVNRKAQEAETAWGTMKPATCFPNGSSVGCSWDIELAEEMGRALGVECRAMGVDILLGPGINTRRTPLGGRTYEYYSEDPFVNGDIAAALINGLQGQGVGTSLKHFACNNGEVERTSMNSVVDMRALREIYLRGFERAIAKSAPWTVMSSYNRLNGVQAAENGWLLDEVLRAEWQFDGLVMSDWHGVKDRPASLVAGNDLDMPESSTRRADLLAAIQSGVLDMGVVDRACERVLQLVRRCLNGRTMPTSPLDHDAHHALARRIAGESIVLLKNEGALLPIKPSVRRIVVIGEGATDPVIQGSGCATTTPTRVDNPLDEIRALAPDFCTVDYFVGTSEDEDQAASLAAAAIKGAKGADVVIIFANTIVGWDGEGSDRSTLALAPGHDDLIAALANVNPATVVVLATPDAVVMPWIATVPAVIETFLSGQATGGAVADILFGVVNPSGKLTSSFPLSIRDIPGYLTYPGENGDHVYSEGVHVGYRWYDSREMPVLFPFGHGLGYSPFRYADLALGAPVLRAGEMLDVTFDVTNAGALDGLETAQVYVRYGAPRLKRPIHELKGFKKTHLAAGETKRVTISIPADDLRYYDPVRKAWILDQDDVTVEVGASSRDIRLEAALQTVSAVARYRLIDWDTQPSIVLDIPAARSGFNAFLRDRLDISEVEAEQMLEHCRSSFFGILTTLDRRLRQRITRTEAQATIDAINARILADETIPV